MTSKSLFRTGLSHSRLTQSMIPALAVLVLSFSGNALSAQEREIKPLAIGAQLPAFELSDFRGREWSSDDFKNEKNLVVVFFGLECPLMKLYAPRLLEIEKEFSESGVQFVGINSNRQDSITEMNHFARVTKIEFPLLKDPGNKIADVFGALRVPEVFIFDKDRNLQYRGRIDDQYTYGRQKPKVEKEYLVEALKSLRNGSTPTIQSAEAHGCVIGRVFTEQKSDEVNYAKHISRILQRRCVSCHRPGEIAPFSLTDYDEVAGWAEMMREVVNENRMPPWHADPAHGKFRNDASLTKEEKQQINTWVENGAPLGDPADLPEPRTFVEGWQIGKPDVVFPMSKKPFKVPATGVVPYEYFMVETNFKEDKWVSQAEIRIGNRSVVHHVIVGVEGNRNRFHGDVDSEWIAACAPGSPPLALPDGYAKRIPAGAKLIFQMHYTPNGTAAEDISSVGFNFIDKDDVKKVVGTQEVLNERFRIPPGAENHEVVAKHRFNKDALILSLFPHMHLRGKSFKYSVKYPDGNSETLLDVPAYDFNWQNGYLFEEPKRIPAGTLMTCVAHFDNSENNIANPDPTKTVRWGDQTFEEMMIGYFDMALADQDLGSFQDSVRTKKALENLETGDLVTDELVQAAKVGIENRTSMRNLHRQLVAAFPQIDRVCWTTTKGNSLLVEQAGQDAAIAKVCRGAGVKSQAYGMKLVEIAKSKKPVSLQRIPQINAPDMEYMGAACRSSFHVPIKLKGKTGSINFWSRDHQGFPEAVRLALEKLVETAMK